LAIVVAVVLLADRLLWPRYSRERFIDPDDVRLATVPPYWPYASEVYRDREPRLLRRLITALNRGRSGPRYKLALGQEIVIHRWDKPSILIRFDELRDGGPLLFRDESRDRSGGLYRSRALRRVLEDICDSRRCQVKSPRIASPSLSRVVLYAGGSHLTLPGSSPQARRVLSFVNENLKAVHTSCHDIPRDATERSFYRGQVEPHTHLTGKTGAMLVLDPPLSMHTTVMLSLPYRGPPAEYHEFKTNVVLIWEEPSTTRRKFMGLSSNARRNRFYLFSFRAPLHGGHPDDIKSAERWKNVIRAIEETVASSNAGTS